MGSELWGQEPSDQRNLKVGMANSRKRAIYRPADGPGMEGERRVLRIGAAGGILGAVILLTAALLSLVLLPTFATTADFLTQYGRLAATYALVNGLGVAGAFITITLFLALHRSLKETNPEYALAGLSFYIVGIALLGIAAVSTFVVVRGNAADYVAGTDAERTAIIAAARSTSRLLFQVSFIGSLFIVLSVLSLGAVMLANRNFGRGYGGLSLLFGALGLVVVPLSLVVPVSVVPNLLLIVYLLVFGWRVFALSKGT